MTPDQFMLVLCIAIAFAGVIWALIAWRRRSGYGRIAHGLALSVAAVGLYLSGLLQLLWQGVRAVLDWVRDTSPDNTLWTGVSFLGAALLIFGIGTFLNSRDVGRPTQEERAAARAERKANKSRGTTSTAPVQPAVSAGRSGPAAPASRPAQADDLDDMAEIEAILKGRGIE